MYDEKYRTRGESFVIFGGDAGVLLCVVTAWRRKTDCIDGVSRRN